MATDDHMKVTAVGLPSGALSATFGRYELENGQHIEDVVLGYSTYGTLNEVRLPIDDALFPPGNARFVTRDFPSRSTSSARRAAFSVSVETR
jgi:homoserine acetyltransferase